MQVALIGFGVENQATYRYYARKSIVPVICDQNPETPLPEGAVGQLGANYLDGLERFDVIVRSVGIHPSVILAKNPGVEAKLTTAVKLFFSECTVPIIGVTGTKGKGTTSTLIHRILQAAGKKTLLAGNIGTPMLDILPEITGQDYIVLELSSFQLYDLTQSPHIAVCLMVVPEHLNWHVDFDDYVRSKANLFRYQNSNNVAVFNAINQSSRDIANASPATTKLSYAVPKPGEPFISLVTVNVEGDMIFCRKQPVMNISEVNLLGRHNLENVCAAIAATWDVVGGNVEVIRQAVSSFTGLEFRLQKIREVNGVTYVNDSFSTTPETAIAALKSFNEPKVLILGGSDKGIPFDHLANSVVGSNVKSVLAIGDQAHTIVNLLQARGFDRFILNGLDTMDKIVKKAHSIAEPGDVVLLSTGCASFDMFKDYKDRGNQFNEAVRALPEAA